MPSTKNETANQYKKNHYETLTLQLPKGNRAYIQQAARDLGYQSTNQFILDAIREKISRK